MSHTPILPPPGWYPDPHAPGRERWWSGTEWTKHEHAAASSWLFGPAYTRSFWPGANTHARRARFFDLIALGLVFAATIALIVVALSGARPGVAVGVALSLASVLAFVGGALTLGHAIAGVRVAGRLGAVGLATQMIYAGVVLLAWSGGLIALLAVSAVKAVTG